MLSERKPQSLFPLTFWLLSLTLVLAFCGFVLGLQAGDFQLSNRSAGVFLLAIMLTVVSQIVEES